MSPRIWVAIRPYARDREHANDLLQDCWVAILNRLHRFKWSGSFARWAIVVSKNVCVDRLRTENRHRSDEVPLDSVLELSGDGADPLHQVRRQQARPIIYAALSRLSVRERDAIVLWALMGHSLKQTASELGVSLPRGRAIVARAMRKLRRMPQMRALLMDWMEED